MARTRAQAQKERGGSTDGGTQLKSGPKASSPASKSVNSSSQASNAAGSVHQKSSGHSNEADNGKDKGGKPESSIPKSSNHSEAADKPNNDDSFTEVDRSKSPLLKLPAELRVIILRELLTFRDEFAFHFGTSAQILRACKLLCTEGTPILYGDNAVSVHIHRLCQGRFPPCGNDGCNGFGCVYADISQDPLFTYVDRSYQRSSDQAGNLDLGEYPVMWRQDLLNTVARFKTINIQVYVGTDKWLCRNFAQTIRLLVPFLRGKLVTMRFARKYGKSNMPPKYGSDTLDPIWSRHELNLLRLIRCEKLTIECDESLDQFRDLLDLVVQEAQASTAVRDLEAERKKVIAFMGKVYQPLYDAVQHDVPTALQPVQMLTQTHALLMESITYHEVERFEEQRAVFLEAFDQVCAQAKRDLLAEVVQTESSEE